MGGSKQYALWPHRVTSSFPHCGDASVWHVLQGRLSTLCPFSLASFPSFGSRSHQEDRSWIFSHPRVGNSANQCWGQLPEDDYRGDSSQPAQLEYISILAAKSLAARKKVSVTLTANENMHLPAATSRWGLCNPKPPPHSQAWLSSLSARGTGWSHPLYVLTARHLRLQLSSPFCWQRVDVWQHVSINAKWDFVFSVSPAGPQRPFFPTAAVLGSRFHKGNWFSFVDPHIRGFT